PPKPAPAPGLRTWTARLPGDPPGAARGSNRHKAGIRRPARAAARPPAAPGRSRARVSQAAGATRRLEVAEVARGSSDRGVRLLGRLRGHLGSWRSAGEAARTARSS